MSRTKWTPEKIAAEAAKYETRGEFQKRSHSAYSAAKRLGIRDEVCGHMEPKRTEWTLVSIHEVAKKFKTRAEFEKNEPKAYNAALKRKVMDRVCGHMVTLRKKWTKGEILEAARKCTSRSEFTHKFNRAYVLARDGGYLEECYAHIEGRGGRCWAEAEIAELALQYGSRSDLARDHTGAYYAALRLGIADKVFAHMGWNLPSDHDAVYVWRAVGEFFKGVPVYKIGVTSARLDDTRIKHVSNASGFTAEIVILRKTAGNATDVESLLKEIGTDPGYSGFSGATEFRAMDDAELALALDIVRLAT